jgi:lipopolysaccharide biosynthesis glycosyltransferase
MVLAACFNRAYVPHVATMLRSFAASNATPARWYLVGDDSVDAGTLAQLVDFAGACGLRAEPLHIPDELVAGFDACGYLPRVAWYRSALPEALPSEDRLVYLDSDLLVLHDLRGLWDVELRNGDYFGAVCQPSYADETGVIARIGLPQGAPYFNSGVMVMELAAMRAEGFTRQLREFFVSPNRPELPTADQCAMNVLFPDRWTALDPTWNCISSIMSPFLYGSSWADDTHHDATVIERAARTPSVVHFEGPQVLKPWNARCFNPFAALYRHYRAMTPWPLTSLEGRRRDALLGRIPPRAQAVLWRLRRRRAAWARAIR